MVGGLFAPYQQMPSAKVVHDLGSLKDDQLNALDRAFSRAAQKRHAVGIILPWVRTERDVIDVLAVLDARPGWSVFETTPRPKRVPAEAGLVTVHYWLTASGAPSGTMMLGPLGWLPAHRRAPYFTLMSWTGGRHVRPRNARFIGPSVV